MLQRIISLVIGYFFGAVFQTGYWLGKLKHIDIREHGSGNAGTTNVMRTMGKKAGVITYIIDTLKAILASAVVRLIYGGSFDAGMIFVFVMYCGLGTVLGHNFPFYLKFKGGKGIAASSGVILSLIPYNWILSLLGFLTFVIVVLISKYVSLGSLCLMGGFFIEMILFGVSGYFGISDSCLYEIYILTFIITALAFIRHSANIKRLLAGNERKIGQKKTENSNII